MECLQETKSTVQTLELLLVSYELACHNRTLVESGLINRKRDLNRSTFCCVIPRPGTRRRSEVVQGGGSVLHLIGRRLRGSRTPTPHCHVPRFSSRRAFVLTSPAGLQISSLKQDLIQEPVARESIDQARPAVKLTALLSWRLRNQSCSITMPTRLTHAAWSGISPSGAYNTPNA